jgi:hypothetical protein
MDKSTLAAVGEVLRELKDEHAADIADVAARSDDGNINYVKAHSLNSAIQLFAQSLIRERSQVISQDNQKSLPQYWNKL